MRTTKRPSTWYSNVPMMMCEPCHQCPLASSVSLPVASLLEAAMRCPLTRSAGNALSVVSWVMGTANRVKGRAVVILSVDATHLLMASGDSDVVGMETCQQGQK